MTESSPCVRGAELTDAAALGRVHVRAWQATYRGMMPDAFLDGLDPHERGDVWARGLATPRDESVRLVVCMVADDDPLGFAVAGPARDGVANESAPRQLLTAATAELSRLEFREAVLWVATGNSRARRFYEAAGWAADGTERTDDSFGPPIDEVCYRRSLPSVRGGGRAGHQPTTQEVSR